VHHLLQRTLKQPREKNLEATNALRQEEVRKTRLDEKEGLHQMSDTRRGSWAMSGPNDSLNLRRQVSREIISVLDPISNKY
jgi:hypothetical protein